MKLEQERDEWARLCGQYKQERDEAREALEFRRELFKVQEAQLNENRERCNELQEKYFAMRDLSNNVAELAEKYKREHDEAWDENKRLREEVEDLKVRYRSAMMDRDSYRFQAEQKYAMRRELEELLGIDHGAPGDEQFKKGLKALKAVVRKAKLYDKKN